MNIDLGQKLDYPEVCCPSPVNVSKESKVHYPSIYIRGGSELKAIPESGTITFRFQRVSQSVRERDDKKTCELELECHEIVGVKSDEAGASKSGSREKIIDALKGEAADEDEEE
jgi:hypothetical protein